MTWVVKIGGSVRDREPVLRDIARQHDPMVLVHGASRDLNELSERLGHPPRMLESGRGDVTRYTDATTMDHFLMAYAGLVNKRIVERLRQLGANAIGLCGLDGGMIRGKRRPDLRYVDTGRVRVLHDNHAGSIDDVDPTLLHALLRAGHTPVLTPPIAAEDGTAINVDGDRLAAEIAIALRADRLVFLADTPGVFGDANDRGSLIAQISAEECASPTFNGRVRPKLSAAARAATHGVETVLIASGTVDAPLQHAFKGESTRVRASADARAAVSH